jgi:hypothetical protein
VLGEYLAKDQLMFRLLVEGRAFDEDSIIFQNNICLALLQDSLLTTIIQQGNLLSARIVALQLQNAHPECEQSISKTYREHVDGYLHTNYNEFHDVVMSKIDEEIRESSPEQIHLLFSPRMDAIDCWNPAANDDGRKMLDLAKASMIVLEKWDPCCSQLVAAAPHQEEEECFHVHPQSLTRTRLCCDFYQESVSQLRLPALQELSLNVRLRTAMTNATSRSSTGEQHVLSLQVHQDGFLRKFDTAAVLWPTAYLLSLCIINPGHCGISELLDSAIRGGSQRPSLPVVDSVELGAGVGLPSLAMSHWLQHQQQPQEVFGETTTTSRVMATDRALHALVLTHLNSQLARLPLIVAHVEDHSNLTQLVDLKQSKHFNNNGGKGCSIVLGSSLQSLF